MNDAFTDVIIGLIAGGPFTPISIDFGGRDTRFGGFYQGNFIGGQAPDTAISPGLGTSVFDQTWQNIVGIDWCNYCVQIGLNGGSIDNLVFDVPASTTPLPAAFPLFASGLGALGLLGWRRKRRQLL